MWSLTGGVVGPGFSKTSVFISIIGGEHVGLPVGVGALRVCSVSSQGSPVPSAIAAFLFWEVPMMYANLPLRRRLLWKGGDAGPPRLPLLCTPYGKCLAAGPAPSTHSASLVGLGLPLLISLRAIGHRVLFQSPVTK